MKCSELEGAALDWAVAKCLAKKLHYCRTIGFTDKFTADDISIWSPSTNWAQGGPIIEREEIDLVRSIPGYAATMGNWDEPYTTGPTLLITAMRCYVASKLGDEIEIPEELK